MTQLVLRTGASVVGTAGASNHDWLRSLGAIPIGYDNNLQASLGRVSSHVKFEVVKTFDDGSYLSWIAPDGKSKKKGATRLPVRVIEYIVEENGYEKIYRLITDLMDFNTFPALLLAREYHQRWETENTLDELKVHLTSKWS